MPRILSLLLAIKVVRGGISHPPWNRFCAASFCLVVFCSALLASVLLFYFRPWTLFYFLCSVPLASASASALSCSLFCFWPFSICLQHVLFYSPAHLFLVSISSSLLASWSVVVCVVSYSGPVGRCHADSSQELAVHCISQGLAQHSPPISPHLHHLSIQLLNLVERRC